MNHAPPVVHPRCGKVRHHSRRCAQEALRVQMQHLFWQGRDRPLLQIYRCRACFGFHLGNAQPDEQKKHKAPYRRASQKEALQDSEE